MIADRHDNVRGQAHEEIRTTTVIGAPHPRLRSMVRAYGGHPVTATPRGNFVLPAAAVVQLVFKLVDSRSRPPEFLIGSRPSRIPIDGTCAPSYIELSVDPLAAYTLLDTPGIEFRGQLVDLGEVVGSRAHDLAERIRDQATWRGRFDLLDAFFLDRMVTGRRPSPEVSRAWTLLRKTGGTMPIGRIVEEVGWSHKHLIAKFTQQIGVTPKTAARLLRFERARRHVDEQPHAGLRDIAAACGYADQSHLNREFRQFTDTTPAEYLRRMTARAPERGGSRSSDAAE